jgi:hypothetical protein
MHGELGIIMSYRSIANMTNIIKLKTAMGRSPRAYVWKSNAEKGSGKQH